MPEPKKYYWLKLKRDFFKRHDIRIIEDMDNGKDYLLFYLKLLVESIDHEGELRFSDTIPYNDKMLATITSTNVDIVRTAVKVFAELGMMERMDNGTLYMSQVGAMIGSDSESKDRVAAFRERRKQIAQHLPAIESHVNNKRHGGHYYKVYERDHGACVCCGATELVEVVHVLPYQEDNFDTLKMANQATVCPKCRAEKTDKASGALELPPSVLDEIGFAADSGLCVTYRLLHVTQEIEIEIEKENSKFGPTCAENAPEDPPAAAPATAVALVPASSLPAKSKKSDMTPEQLALYNEIKGWFEAVPESKALMFKDKAAAGRTGKALKVIVERCFNHVRQHGGDPRAIAYPMVKAFYSAIYKAAGRDKLRVGFTPVGLCTEWVWDAVYMQCKDKAEATSIDRISDMLNKVLVEKEARMREKGVAV